MKVNNFLFCFLLLLSGLHSALSQDSLLISFELKDQYDREYTEKHFVGKVVVFVGSDKEGSQYNERWSKAIHDSLRALQLQDSVTFMAVANLDGVPGFFRGLVKGKFPKDGAQSILLDWKGRFADAYQLVPDVTNLLLFNTSGKLVYRAEGKELDPKKLDRFVRQISRLLK